jgi:hypothetical protein
MPEVNKHKQNRLRQAGAQLAPLGFHLQGPAKLHFQLFGCLAAGQQA